jgi:uncharacterized protein (TIGR02145 family)
MMRIFKSAILINALVLFFFFLGCKKEEKVVIPVLSTTAISNISAKTATSGGKIISGNGASITERGVCWSKEQMPTISDNTTKDSTGGGSFISLLTNLDSLSTYYVRAYATNSAGTGYGTVVSFKTSASLPIILTTATDKINQYSAIYGGVIKSNGGVNITASGICWSTNTNPVITDSKAINVANKDTFTCFISSLTPNTQYYVRAYATNISGTSYGDALSLVTKQEIANMVEDNDGNVYNTVTIGTQTWMQENLKTTKYSDWTDIPNVIDSSKWVGLTTPAYCWYKNDPIQYKSAYGALYNWYAITTTKNICPAGWHVSTDADWQTLLKYLKPEAGSKIKEAGTLHWNDPNTATNSSGFSAVPSGYRLSGFTNNLGNYPEYNMDLTQFSDWWVKFDNVNPEYYELRRNDNVYVDLQSPTAGMAIRCVKN